MTDQKLIQALTEEFAPRIRELCADDKMDCEQLCAGNILTAKCIVFQVAERLRVLRAANTEKDKEIEKLRMQVRVKDACISGKSSIITYMETERDAAKPSAEVLEAIDELVEFARDRMSIGVWLGYVNVLNEWRGAQEEGREVEKLTNERFAEIIRDKEICKFCEDCGNDDICINCKKVKPATVKELRLFWKELSALVKARDEGRVVVLDKRILDVACGGKMFWFNKHNPDVEFCDKRTVERHEYYPHRYIEILPDTVCDFTRLPFEDGAYHLVVFDPPHLTRAGDTSWTALKYGCLKGDWKEMLRKGFEECFRVLKQDGVLIFKWSEVQIPLREILPLSPYPPLFGNRSGKHNNTHWLCFMKPQESAQREEGQNESVQVRYM